MDTHELERTGEVYAFVGYCIA